ncbi:MAG: hypothetical protein AAF485_22720, partial [Chloroflexota bacterium]
VKPVRVRVSPTASKTEPESVRSLPLTLSGFFYRENLTEKSITTIAILAYLRITGKRVSDGKLASQISN